MAHSIIEFDGIYGGSQSRDVVLRLLKEALALIENTDPTAELICSGFRIEIVETEQANTNDRG